jgi:predicted NBD/HSP70 family sugar kinase
LNAERPQHLAKLDLDATCSCGRPGHLAALIGVDAVQSRVFPASAKFTAWPSRDDMPPGLAHALADAGRLLGSTLAVAVAVLAPDAIYITGPLAHPLVADGVTRTLWDSHVDRSSRLPELLTVQDRPARKLSGAALPVFRQRVYRSLALAQEPDWNSAGPVLEDALEVRSIVPN